MTDNSTGERPDLIVIGAGPGGYETAAAAARMGKRVTLIERDLPGGTCLNRGCVPTKCLCASAQALTEMNGAAELGIMLPQPPKPDYAAIHGRMTRIVEELRQGVVHELAGVNVIHGEARLASTGPSVWVNGEQLFANDLIIATGSAPAMLPIPGADLCLDSTAMLALEELPQSLVVIGGGVIGMEFAGVFAALGVEVTVLEFCKEILPGFDAEVAKRLRTLLSRRGVKCVTQARVTAVEQAAEGSFTVSYVCKGRQAQAAAAHVLMAVGRRPVLPPGWEDAGIKVDRRGAIMVNDDFLTSRDHIYAIGDCNGRCMLAHAATAQGLKVLGQDVNLGVIPADLFTNPPAAMVGLTEEQCRERELHYKVSKVTFASNAKARTAGHTDGLVKLITDPVGGAILGCHILGADAPDLIQEVAGAMASSLTVRSLAATIHAHPTLTEVIQAAARQAL